MARRRPEFESGFAGAEAAKLKKFSDGGGPQIQWLHDEARNRFFRLFMYKGISLNEIGRIDFLVDKHIVLELKTVEAIAPIHIAQLLTYLKMGSLRTGLIINFNVPVLKRGIKRVSL